MSLLVETYPVMPTRPCSFCLVLQDGSVFADFDTDPSGHVTLRRISFDSFGCCRVEGVATTMDSKDSRVILDAVASNEMETSEVEETLRKYFRENSKIVWEDALKHHELV